MLPGAGNSAASAVADDGLLIVGASSGTPEHPFAKAFIGTAEKGMASVPDVPTDFYCLDLSGWNLLYATDISTDGQTVVGNDNIQGWVAFTPSTTCIRGDFTSEGLVTPDDIGPFAAVLVAPCKATLDERCAANVNEDWLADGPDIQPFVDMLLEP